MRVLLINPAPKYNARSVAIPLGLIAVASYLQHIGHEIRLIDRSVDRVNALSVAQEFKPEVVGVSVVGHKSLPDAIKFSVQLRKKGFSVVWGGPCASSIAKTCLENGYADYISTGEGELVWEELLEAFAGKRELSTIKGLAYFEGDKYHYLGQHELADLADFPEMDFTLVQPQKYFQKTFDCNHMLHICAAKGCPNHCIYCYNHDFNLSVYRKRPLEQVMHEITYLVEQCGMDGIYFTDEMWAFSREEVHEYCRAFIDSGLDFVWGCQTVIGRFTKEDYQLMYEAGCRWLFFGIETGSADLLRKLGKKLNTDEVYSNIKYCNESGIVSIAGFMVGVPMETVEDLKKTVQLAQSIHPSYYNITFYYPLPKTAIYDRLVQQGKLKPFQKGSDYFADRPTEKIKKLTDIPPIDIKVIRSYFMWKSFACSNIKTDDSKGKFFFMKKTIIEAIESTLHHGIANFFVQVFYSAREICSTMFYCFCFPRVRKKYGIPYGK